jgi:hypothetical protein
MSPQALFRASVIVGALALVTMAFVVVRLVLTRLRADRLPSPAPPRVTWLSPIVLIPVALIALCIAMFGAFLAFWLGCTTGPDLC